jgi:hypothetical protein
MTVIHDDALVALLPLGFEPSQRGSLSEKVHVRKLLVLCTSTPTTTMKKGFLNSGKAKARLTKDTDSIAGRTIDQGITIRRADRFDS